MKIARPVALARTRLHECAVTWFLMDVKTNSEDSPINLIPDFPIPDDRSRAGFDTFSKLFKID